eukprot:m.22456 g.22456  ORF g.22456 m.22456 type:complete len:449 (-) comp13825_c0_seq1:153-1499(-)
MVLMVVYGTALAVHSVYTAVVSMFKGTTATQCHVLTSSPAEATALDVSSRKQMLTSTHARSGTANPSLTTHSVAPSTLQPQTPISTTTHTSTTSPFGSPATPSSTPWLSVVMQPDSSGGGGFGSEFCSAGDVLKLIDVAAAMAAHSHAKGAAGVVTLSYDRADFQIPVFAGDLLSLDSEIVRIGRTSMTVLVTGKKRELRTRKDFNNIFRSLLTFVALDKNGKPTEVPKLPHSDQLKYAEMAPKADTRKKLHQELDKLEANVLAQIDGGAITWDTVEEPWNKSVGERLSREETTLVYRHMFMPKNKNMGGSVFGGDIVEWMEECARHCARHFTKSDRVKTVSMHRQYFLEKVLPGDLVECTTHVVYTGKHSVHVSTSVMRHTSFSGGDVPKLSHVGHFVIVCYDRVWRKTEVSTGLDLSTSEVGLKDYAVAQVRQKFLISNWDQMLLL